MNPNNQLQPEQPEFYNFPFNFLPDENLTHVAENISLKIVQSTDDLSIVLSPLDGRLVVTNLRMIWYSTKPETLTPLQAQIAGSLDKQHASHSLAKEITINNANGKSIVLSYSDLVSHGLNQMELQCFLGRDELGDDVLENQDPHSALALELQNQTTPSDMIEISGHYQVVFSLKNLQKDEQEVLFERVTQCAVEYPMSEEPEANDGWGDMITADQIDDDGNLLADKLDGMDGEDEDDEDQQDDDSWDDDMDVEKEEKKQ